MEFSLVELSLQKFHYEAYVIIFLNRDRAKSVCKLIFFPKF